MYNNKSLKERQLFDEKLIQASSECSTCALTQDKKKGKAGINRNAKITKYRRSLINNMNAIAEQNFVKTSQRFSDLVKKCQGKRGSFEMKQPTRLLTEEEKADGQSNDMSAATVATLAELADRVATAEGETNADYQTNENEDVQDSYTFVSSSPFRGQHVDANGNIRRKDISTVQPYEMIYIDFYQLPAEQFCARQYALIFVDYKTFNVDVHLCKYIREFLLGSKAQQHECSLIRHHCYTSGSVWVSSNGWGSFEFELLGEVLVPITLASDTVHYSRISGQPHHVSLIDGPVKSRPPVLWDCISTCNGCTT